MAGFSGFSKGAFSFLHGLEKNNDKKWFDAHRARYKDELLEPAKLFVEALGAKLAAFTPEINAEPRVNGSIFRINRDVRFSKDKRPYKTHLDLWFWEGASKRGGDASGYFFRMFHDRVLLGAGMHGMDKSVLARFRAAVADDATGKSLVRALAAAERAGFEVGGEHYKRVPKGYDPEHPRANLLRHNAMHAGLEAKLPADVGSKKFVTWCAGRFKKVSALQAWLARIV